MTKSTRVFDASGRDVTDDFDDNHILKDKHSVRYPLHFKDSAGNVIDARHKHTVQYDPSGRIQSTFETREDEQDDSAMDDSASMVVCDGAGHSDPVSLGIPGPRYLRAGRNTTDHARLVTLDADRETARNEAIKYAQDAWKNPELKPAPAPAHQDSTDARDAAWSELQNRTQNAWRS
jgi:hypothetical protein